MYGCVEGIEPIPDATEEVGRKVVDAIFALHKNLGPGAVERVYCLCLAHELTKRGLKFQRELRLPIRYDGLVIDAGYRTDFLVESQVLIEVKAVEKLLPVHKAQAINYLKLSGRRLGFLVNFNVALTREGIRRVVR